MAQTSGNGWVRIHTYQPTPAQLRFHNSRRRYRLYGGAMGGGKSRALCEGALIECLRYPGNYVFLGRKALADLMHSTYRTLTEKSTLVFLLEKRLVTENRSLRVFEFWNGSRLFYGGVDSGGAREKVFSTEFGAVFVDEAWEMEKEQFLKLASRLRHTLPKDAPRWHELSAGGTKLPQYHLSLASNPAQNWIRTRFVTNPQEDSEYIPALPKDNPHNPDDYEKRLRGIFAHDERMYRAFVEGRWDEARAVDDLLGWEQIRPCIGAGPAQGMPAVSCDPGRFGDDSTVIYGWRGAQIVKRLRLAKKDTMEVVGWILSTARETGPGARIVVDETGTGGGVVDRLRELGSPVTGINFASAAGCPERFANKRAEMYWNARAAVCEQRVRIPEEAKMLVEELCAVKFRFVSDGRLAIEPKDEIKRRLGRSPDEADCFVLGLEILRDEGPRLSDFAAREFWKDPAPVYFE